MSMYRPQHSISIRASTFRAMQQYAIQHGFKNANQVLRLALGFEPRTIIQHLAKDDKKSRKILTVDSDSYLLLCEIRKYDKVSFMIAVDDTLERLFKKSQK